MTIFKSSHHAKKIYDSNFINKLNFLKSDNIDESCCQYILWCRLQI